MKREKLSSEAVEVLHSLELIERGENKRAVAIRKSADYVNSFNLDKYEKYINSLCELAYHKFIFASGKRDNNRYVFDKLRITRRGKKYLKQELQNITHFTDKKKQTRTVDDKVFDKNNTIARIERIVLFIVAIISCIFTVYSALK